MLNALNREQVPEGLKDDESDVVMTDNAGDLDAVTEQRKPTFELSQGSDATGIRTASFASLAT